MVARSNPSRNALMYRLVIEMHRPSSSGHSKIKLNMS